MFTALDGAPGQESAIVNTRFAQMHFPKEDPIGRRIVLSIDLAGGPPPTGGIPTSLTATIVGIAPNVRQRDFAAAEPDPVAYLPYRTDPRGVMTLLARSEGDPNALTPLLREEVRAIDADLPLYGIRTMDENLAQARWPFRVFGTMFAIFAFIALMLSAVGLYAVTAYSVSQRTQEIGVRMALGAQSTQVTWLFLRRAFFHLGIGLTLGVAGAFGVGKDLRERATPGSDERTGSGHDRIDCGAAGRRVAGRLRVAGAPGDAARSAGRAAAGIGTARV